MKSWKDTEEGRMILAELREHNDALLAIKMLGKACADSLTQQMVNINPRTVGSDRSLLIAKAELDGALNMLNSILGPIEEGDKRKTNGKPSN